MTPENVPNELLSLYGRNYVGRTDVEAERRALAAVLTEHERLVREQVAREIEEDADELDRQKVKSGAAYVRRAAHRARGETR